MSAKCFLDTNTLVYVLEGKDPTPGCELTPAEIEANRKGNITLSLLHDDHVIVGVQVFNELCNVALRRKFDWPRFKEMLVTLQALCLDIVPLTMDVHRLGIALHEKYKRQFYDALMVGAALQAGCVTFYSEDMQHDQVIERTMTIKNPFRTFV